jgi:uncharacterized RDD family membrane protein YckC
VCLWIIDPEKYVQERNGAMTGRRYGGFWRRSFAFFIDEVILYFVTLILFLIGLLALGLKGKALDHMLATSEGVTSGMGLFGLLYIAASLLAGMTYFTWFHGVGGRTPGKMLLGLRVIQASGDPMTPGIAFLRWVGYLISGPVFCLGFLWIAFDGRKQGWHDKIAATLVVRERYESDLVERDSTTASFAGPGMEPTADLQETVVPTPEQPQEKTGADVSQPLP